jgi:hypothetical protein
MKQWVCPLNNCLLSAKGFNRDSELGSSYIGCSSLGLSGAGEDGRFCRRARSEIVRRFGLTRLKRASGSPVAESFECRPRIKSNHAVLSGNV